MPGSVATVRRSPVPFLGPTCYGGDMPNGNGNGGNGNGNGPVPPTPPTWLPPNLPPELAAILAPLLGVIASGVTRVSYADRTIQYASIGDLLKAWGMLPGLVGLGGPRRRFACFSKGFDTGWGGIEHQEIRDYLWSRQFPGSPGRLPPDVDWERAA
jgi:hypothetical protein